MLALLSRSGRFAPRSLGGQDTGTDIAQPEPASAEREANMEIRRGFLAARASAMPRDWARAVSERLRNIGGHAGRHRSGSAAVAQSGTASTRRGI
jgi:hypothetical protein